MAQSFEMMLSRNCNGTEGYPEFKMRPLLHYGHGGHLDISQSPMSAWIMADHVIQSKTQRDKHWLRVGIELAFILNSQYIDHLDINR